MPTRKHWLICTVIFTSQAQAARAQDTVRFTPTVGHPTFAVRDPVLRIKPQL